MKKSSPKKISLSRETLRNLHEAQLETAAGGVTLRCTTSGAGGTCYYDSCPRTCSYTSC
jgi:hypothetical protein